MNLPEQIVGCFGTTDQVFAGHPNERNRALDLLRDCISNNVGLAEIELAAREHLDLLEVSGQHKEDQLAKVKAHLSPWL
jgi:hypothetical protein